VGIEELQGGGADLLVDGVTVDAGGIDAGLGNSSRPSSSHSLTKIS
jgi:hypothetical protein